MLKLNIHEAKTHLSRYLARLPEEERIILCKRNVPIAEIRPLAPEEKSKRPVGLARGKFKVTEDFFGPLPEEILDAFSGESQ